MNKDQFELKRVESQLRSDAEGELEVAAPTGVEPRSAEVLLHELQVHQIELEMQNEALRQTQAALEASRDRFVDLYDFAPVGYCTLTDKGMIAEINLTGASLLGEERKKLLLRRFSPFVAEADRDRWLRFLLSAFKQEEKQACELVMQRADHSCFDAHLDCLPIHEPNGVLSLRVAVTDISLRKSLEKQQHIYVEKVARSNKDLQDFAFVASHDLQEPLRKISAFGDVLRRHAAGKLDEAELDYLTRMDKAARRMSELIEGLLSYSRVGTSSEKGTLVNLNECLHETLEVLERPIENTGATIELGEMPVIEAFPAQLQQFFQNLIGNALKFIDPTRKPIIKIAAVDFMGEGNVPMTRITVADNGIGFDPKFAERIFLVFERLHGRSEYEGTGIGLALCRKIVERLGGSITAEGRLGEGAAFVVNLPLRSGAAQT